MKKLLFNSEKLTLQEVREKLLIKGIWVFATVLPCTLLFSLLRYYKHGWHPVISFHIICSLLLIAGAIFAKKLPYRANILILFGVVLGTGTAGLFAFGLLGGGVAILFTFAMLCAITFGVRAGLIACGLNIVILAVAGYFYCTNIIIFPYDIGEYATSVPGWAIMAAIFFMFAPITIIALGVIHNHLERSLSLLHENHQKQENLVNNLKDAFLYRHDINNIFTYVSSSVEEITGFDADYFTKHVEQLLTNHPCNTQAKQYSLASCQGIQQAPYDVQLWDKNGNRLWFEVSESPIKNEAGEVVAVEGLAHNITKRKIREETLAVQLELSNTEKDYSEEELLQAFLDQAEKLTNSSIGFFHLIDEDHKNLQLKTWSSNTLSAMCKRGKGKSQYAIKEAGLWLDALRKGQPVIHNDYQSLKHKKGLPQGHAPVVRQLVVPIYHQNSPVAVIGVGNKKSDYNNIDIEIVSELASAAWQLASRKQSEEKLLFEQQRTVEVLEATNAGSWEWNILTDIITVSDRWAKIVGYSLEEIGELSFKKLKQYIHPADLPLLETILEQHLKKENDFFSAEFRHIHKDGSWVWIGSRGKVLEWDNNGQPLRMSGTHIDITEKKVREEQGQIEHQQLLSIFEHMDEVIYVAHPETYELLYTNSAFNNLYGKTIGKKCHEAIFGETAPCSFCSNRQIFGEHIGETYTSERQDSSTKRWYRCLDRAIRWTDGQMVKFQMALDITDQKNAKAEQERLMSAIEQVAEMVVITDHIGEIQYVNPAFERISGYSRKEVIGQHTRILKSGKHPKEFYRNMWTTLNSGKSWNGRLTNRKKDGSLYTEDTVISPVLNSNNEIVNFVAVKSDITQEVALEKHIRQNQKMEAIGTLATGIAHDFNNILSGIIGFAELLEDDLVDAGSDKATLNKVQRIVDGGLRGRDLVVQILSFSRTEQESAEIINIVPLAKEVIKLLQASIPSSVNISSFFYSQTPVLAEPVKIHQLLMNLCSNASYAMQEEGGTLTISTNDILLDEPLTTGQLATIPTGSYLLLSIKDTGKGIEENIIDKIMEPFFTTKPKEKGTGMGLWVVHGIVKNMGGYIDLNSKVGEGTLFNIYLPATEQTVPIFPTRVTEKPPSGNERILFIDDEVDLTKLAEISLTKLGYDVVTFNSSIEALAHFKDNSTNYDLIITDLTMPNMSGEVLAKHLKDINDKQKIILCTGRQDDLGKNSEKLFNSVLNKPLLVSEMGKKIRLVLERGSL